MNQRMNKLFELRKLAETGTTTGGVIGGVLGGAAGGTVGLLGGPAGAAVGAGVGAAAGSALGYNYFNTGPDEETTAPAATPRNPYKSNETIKEEILTPIEAENEEGYVTRVKQLLQDQLQETMDSDDLRREYRRRTPSSASGSGTDTSRSSSSGGSSSPSPRSNSSPSSPDRSSRSRSSSGKQQADTQPLVIKYPADTQLKDNLYLYEVMDPKNSFEWVLLSDRSKNGTFERSKVGNSKWNKSVNVLNSLTPINSPAAAPTTPITTAPAATSEPAPAAQGQGEVVVDNLVTNVARILSNVDAGHTYALRTAANERGMVRRMISQIESMPQSAVVDAPLSLAKVIVGYTRSALANSNLAKADPGQLASMGEKDIERTFRGELDIIMRAVVRLDAALGGKSGYGKLSSYIRIEAPRKPDEMKTPAPPASPQSYAPRREPAYGLGGGMSQFTEFGNKQTSFDPRIKKLAKLRRLKVRAQMEAAIEPSAKFGRSRVS